MEILLRKQCVELYGSLPISDRLNEACFFPNTVASYILSLENNGDIQKIILGALALVKCLGFESLVFMGDTEMPWLSQKNEAREVKDAFQYFKLQNINSAFNGGVIVDTSDLKEFVEHLFWLIRLNASFPTVHFTDKNQRIIGSVCKYGNVHFYTLDNEIDNIFKSVVKQGGFKLLTQGETCS